MNEPVAANFLEAIFFTILFLATVLSFRCLTRMSFIKSHCCLVVLEGFNFSMEETKDAVLLGFVIYFILIMLLIIINEAFCKAACMKYARRVANGNLQDIEINERKPSKEVKRSSAIITKDPSRHDRGDIPKLYYQNNNCMYVV